MNIVLMFDFLIHQSGICINQDGNDRNAYSFDCYTAVFIRANMQTRNVLFLNSQFSVGMTDALGGVVNTNSLLLIV